MDTSPARPFPTLALVLLLLGGTGFAAAWCLLSGSLETQAAWMAPFAALDAWLMLRLGGMRGRPARAALAVLGTALTIALANWGIAALEIGRSVGLLPWESVLRMGPSYAWELSRLANGSNELGWYAASLLLAAIVGLRRS